MRFRRNGYKVPVRSRIAVQRRSRLSRTRQLQHAVRQIEADRGPRIRSRGKEQIACPAREIEDTVVSRHGGKVDQPLFPASVLAIREKPGDEVVAVGNGRKQPPYVEAFTFRGGDGRAEGQ